MFDAVLVPLIVVCMFCLALFFVPAGIEPILLSMLVAVGFFRVLKRKNHGIFPIEIGSFYFAVVFLYCTMPFVGFALNGFEYHIFSDSRLFSANPSPEDVVHIGYYYILYLMLFATTYLVFRKPGGSLMCDRARQPSLSIVIFLIISYLLLELPMLYLKYAAMGWAPQGYGQHYLWVYEYPLVVRQILNHLSSIVIILQIFIITYLFLMYPRARALIVVLLLFKFLSLIFLLGARMEFALLLAATIVCYYNCVKVFSLRKAIIVGVVFVALFLFIGWGRDLQDIPWELFGSFFPSTEFESIFGNAFDIYSRKLNDSIDAPSLYPFEGILNFIPQQLLPFEKPSLSRWYVDTFYSAYSETGGGFAFGVVAESLLSDTAWISISWRACFHGLLLEWIYNIFHRNRLKPVQVSVYIWLTVLSYQLFRDTTFSLLPKVFMDLLPVFALVYVFPKISKPSRVAIGR